jgi:hypothetical protein
MEYTIKDNFIVIKLEEKAAASLSFHVEGNKMYLDSTFTPPKYRGRGIGSELVQASIEYAKKNGLTIVPVCEFAVEYFKKHREYGSLVQQS